MPPHMLRRRSLSLTLTLLSLSSVPSLAWAADPPLCPSTLQTSQTNSEAPAKPPKEQKPGVNAGPVEIDADRATDSTPTGISRLQGNVVLRQGDREIHAQEAEYNRNTQGIKSQGPIEYQDPVMHVTGQGGDYSPAAGADVHSSQFQLRQHPANGTADTLKLTPQGIVDMKGVKFTTCPKGEQAWKIAADSITLDTRSRVGEARDAKVDFEGVPIIYLPWLSFPLGNDRKSGFLFPTIGSTSRSGAELEVPYYWNIAPNADFTFEPIIYSRRGADLGGDLRFLTSNDHGELNWNYLPYDNVFGSSRSLVKLVNVMELPDHFRFSIDAENVSDSNYFEDFATGPEGTSTAFVQQQAAVTYRDEHWKLDAEMQHYQTIDNTLVDPALGGSPLNKPYARLPRIAVDADYGDVLKYGLESELVNFDRSINIDRASSCLIQPGVNPCVTGWRLDFMPSLGLDFGAPGWFIRPGIAWRATQYELD